MTYGRAFVPVCSLAQWGRIIPTLWLEGVQNIDLEKLGLLQLCQLESEISPDTYRSEITSICRHTQTAPQPHHGCAVAELAFAAGND